MRVAFVTPTNPVNADSGGKQFSMDRLMGLAELAQVDVFCMSDTQEEVQRLSERLKGRPVYCAGRLKPRSVMQWMLSILFGLPLSVWRNRSTDFLKLIQSKHSAGYDLIYVDHWLMWPVASCFQRKTPRVLNLHNAEHLIFERAAQGRKGIFHLALRFESWRVRRYLKKIASSATFVHAISEADKLALESIDILSNRITAILPSVDLNVPHSGRPGGRVLFAGTLSWAPNAEGLNWFLCDVLPELALDKPVMVAGGTPWLSWLSLPHSNKVEFLGRVPSIDPLYEAASVLIAPVFSGSGIKLKIVNSLARGIPVVTTSCGIEGFPPGWESFVKVCDTPSEFSQAVMYFVSNSDSWASSSQQARQYVCKHFSREVAMSQLEQCLYETSNL